MRLRPALPLSLQLVLTFVSLLVGMTAVLTRSAQSSLRSSLEEDAGANVSAATRSREQAISRIFAVRQQRADAFLQSLFSICGEGDKVPHPLADDCTNTMLGDFSRTEGATRAFLENRVRRRQRFGNRINLLAPEPGETRLTQTADGDTMFVMRARYENSTLTVQFDDEDIDALFADAASALGRGSELWLLARDGKVLAPTWGKPLPPETAAWILDRCTDIEGHIAPDATGKLAVMSRRPVPILGGACVAAHIDHATVIAPVERLRLDLVNRASYFVIIGAALSFIAAQWIAGPVRRLASAARHMQSGKFDRPIPLAGPSEVRALGSAFNAMNNDLAEMVAREQSARREAEAANRAKDDFLATVSHELRTPLTAILGWAHMLQSERLPPDRVRHAIDVISRAANAQRQLIEDLLDVSRVVSNRLQIAREPVRLAEIVEAALDTVRLQAKEANVTIETDLAPDAVVLGDGRRLEQVVWNLAWNAVKFTQPSGKISVKLAQADGQAVLSVADTGVGISSAFLPHIFEWFRQGESRASSQAGLGLGLGLVRHLVRLHGGSVTAQSAGEGHGATFIVRLPLHVAATVPARETQQGEPRTPPDRRLVAVRVLVVEDDDDTRELVRVTLENAGAHVEAVSSAKDARREIEAEAPDVLISDIRMPEEDGYSLIRALRTAGVSTPAIALTALARREDAEAARAAGYQVHIAKPLDSGNLVEAVASIVRPSTVH